MPVLDPLRGRLADAFEPVVGRDVALVSQLVDAAVEAVDSSDARLAELAEANASMGEEISGMMALIRRMTADLGRKDRELDGQRKQSSHAEDIRRIFDHWVVMCHKNPKTTKLGAAREKAVLARLRDGYDIDYILRAVDGAARFAYRDNSGKVHNDLELICRNEVKLERFEELGRRARRESSGDDA